uniref:Uncharacterized protein n=1 Tax=Brassica oleracea TaxID=3712 RepID=A0A3P6E7W7_BRAOL|nr:unnamed protein product [Brassica oleracea]
MVSSRVSDSPAPKAHNGNVSSSASVQVTRSLVTDPEAAVSASKYHMYTNSDDSSLHSFLANSRVYSNVGRSHVRSSSYYICSEVKSSRETLVAARGQTEPTMSLCLQVVFDIREELLVLILFYLYNDGWNNKDELNDEKFSSEEVSYIPSAPPIPLAVEESGKIKPASIQVSEASDTMEIRPNTSLIVIFSQFCKQVGLSLLFLISARGTSHAVVSYDACVRLCLHAWAKGCMEARMFLENECALLREAFGVKEHLSLSEEEMLVSQSSQAPHEGVAPKPKKNIGKMMVQVWRVKTDLDAAPTGNGILYVEPSLKKIEKLRVHFSNISTRISSKWRALKKINLRANGYFLLLSICTKNKTKKKEKYIYEHVIVSVKKNERTKDKKYLCRLRLKSSTVDDAVIMQSGSDEEGRVFFLDSHEDDLIVEIFESKGKEFGRALVPLAKVTEVSAYSLSWESVFREPGHQLVGKIQIHFDYSASSDDNSHLKGCSVAETVAYDLVLEVALKTQWFQQRKLLLYGSWKWLLEEFASYYGISDVYTKLRYLTYVMDVATPTSDCLHLVHDLLAPVITKGNGKATLSHQENGILNEIKNQTEQILKLVFENYKSLDESSFSGMNDVVSSATGVPAPALAPAVKVYMLLHDILSPKDQSNLCNYFQVGAKKISRMHMGETDEFVTNNNDPNFWDPSSMSSAYKKMTMVCKNVKNEIYTDIEIHNQYILPSFLDLPNLSASIYSTDLRNRLRTFLVACPPSGPSPAVAELVIATVEFQRDLSSWNIGPIQAGVDAKELFHQYIMIWIQDRRLSLLESCKLDKVQWGGVGAHRSTTPFVDEMYTRLNETIQDYQVIISRWPKCIFVLESAIADVEKAIVEALEKQYANVLSPLKENLAPKKPYVVPDELGILLNTMKRMLDVLRYNIEAQFKAWSSSCIPDGGNVAPGDRLSEVTVMLRAKFRSYLQAVVEKLVQNVIFFYYCFLQKATTLKKILQDSKGISHCACSKESVGESDMRNLKEQLTNTLNNLHSVCATHVFIALSRGYWDRMGEIVLSFLENKRENRAWYKGPRVAVSMLDDTFAAEMQKLLGDSLREQDLEPPRSIVELRWILCKDTTVNRGKSFDY